MIIITFAELSMTSRLFKLIKSMLNMRIRKLRREDATQVSNIIRRCLREVNSKDYPKKAITSLYDFFTPALIIKNMGDRTMYVAVEDDKVIGIEIEGASSLLNMSEASLSSLDDVKIIVKKAGNILFIGFSVIKKEQKSTIQFSVPLQKPAVMTAN